MTIPRIGFTHTPPWKYAVLVKYSYGWYPLFANRGYRNSRYRTILAAMQAAENYKARGYEARIVHINYINPSDHARDDHTKGRMMWFQKF